MWKSNNNFVEIFFFLRAPESIAFARRMCYNGSAFPQKAGDCMFSYIER